MRRIGLIGLMWVLLAAVVGGQDLVPIPQDHVQIYRRYYATPVRDALFGRYRIGPSQQPKAPIQKTHQGIVLMNAVDRSQLSESVALSSAVCRVETSRAAGSGTLIAQNEQTGVVLTAEHVTRQGERATCIFRDGSQRTGKTYSTPDGIDAAIVVIASVPTATPVPIATQDPPIGASCLMLGYGGSNSTLWTAATRFAEVRQYDQASSYITRPGVFVSGDSGGILAYNGKLVGVIEAVEASGEYGTGPNVVSVRRFLTQYWPNMQPGCPSCPPITPRQRPDRVPVPPVTPTPLDPKPEPKPVEIDYSKLIDLMAADGRFKGKDGKDGALGPAGQNAVVDYDTLTSEVVNRLPPIYIHKENVATGEIATEEIHLGEGFIFRMHPHSLEHGE